MKKLTTEEFIEKVRDIHSNRYDYSKVVYVGTHIKVIIICSLHGEFEQTPSAHLQGCGCCECGFIVTSKKKTLTTADFIKRSIIVHDDKYDYSKSVYKKANKKIKIICPIHGSFYQVAIDHIGGHGCSKCGSIATGNLIKSNTQEFIEKAREVHGDKYDYSKVEYVNNYDKVIITCKEHGDFDQSSNNHLCGAGCPICKGIACSKLLLSNTEEFIEKSRAIHGDKYDYSKVDYVNNTTKVIIICPIHGEFEQIPNNHLSGKGCSICSSSKGELAIKTILEKYNIQYIQQYRIPEVVNRLSYDFYLPVCKLLIEFHGEQHYEYIPFFHRTEDGFLAQKNRDDIVRSNARYFKYRYLEFNYKQLKHMSKEEFENLVKNKINRYIV